jgi:hypothetical protein
MKKLAICLMLSLQPISADAGVVQVVTRPVAMGGGADYLAFNYDEFGKAWVEERDQNGYTSGDWTTFPRFELPTLRFDAASRQILFGRVVCANVVSMAAGFAVVNTGRCKLRSSIRDMGPAGPRLENVVMEVR